MRGVIRVGDRLTSGGVVLSGAAGMSFKGRAVARVGDKVQCPIPGHGVNVIVEGDPGAVQDGRPIALEGHRCACGCALISSLPQAGKR